MNVREAPWWPQTLVLVAATLSLGAALLVPLAFSDPNGVDPYAVRLTATAIVLATAGFALRRLTAARPVLLGLVAVTATYTVLSAGPQALQIVLGMAAPGYDAQVFWASLAQALLTVGVVVVAARLLAPTIRPVMRLRRISPAGIAIGIAGSAALLLVGLALPAALLGRYGVAPVAISRDLPWLGPANGFQAFAQEVQFRGLLLGALERTMSPRWANVAQAAVFGLAHLAVSYGGPEAPFVPVTFLAGLGFGWLVRRTGSIWPAVIIHAAADIALTFAVVPGLYGL